MEGIGTGTCESPKWFDTRQEADLTLVSPEMATAMAHLGMTVRSGPP